jgi:hypothetical protein
MLPPPYFVSNFVGLGPLRDLVRPILLECREPSPSSVAKCDESRGQNTRAASSRTRSRNRLQLFVFTSIFTRSRVQTRTGSALAKDAVEDGRERLLVDVVAAGRADAFGGVVAEQRP